MNRTYLPIVGIDRLRIGSDGPGVRTLVGLYGCPLRCKYCINPQAWNGTVKPQLMTPAQLYDTLRIDSLYFQATGGGITFGGGEPLLYAPSLDDFAQLCPADWNLCVETALNVKPELLSKASKIFDYFVVDIKTLNAAIYTKYTGKPLTPVMDNLMFLKKLIGEDRITVRIPIIPGYTDHTAQQKDAQTLAALGFTDIDLFSYTIKQFFTT